jgi:hypothetical protein
MPEQNKLLFTGATAVLLPLLLASAFSLAAAQSSSSYVSYPFVVGATRCYSCGFGNYSNRSGAEVCFPFMPLSKQIAPDSPKNLNSAKNNRYARRALLATTTR